MRALMKRVFLSPFVALTAGLGLRLYFALKFPANSGDTLLYEQIATNWLKHHVFAMTVGGAITPVDLRMPGYPAFLAIVYALTGRTGADARLWVMLAQVIVDLCSCIFVASLASLFALLNSVSAESRHAFLVALWLSAVCPFTANYVAVPLTEVFAVFFTSIAMLALIALLWHQSGGRVSLFRREWATMHAESILALLAGFLVGLGTLFRPEMPLLLVSFWAVLAFIWFRRRRFLCGLQLMGLSALACLAPLAPWAIRNAITLHEIRFLAPKNSNLPGELVPYGFMAWEKTWLYRVRDCYLVSWKLNEESIDVEEIPARAFDTPEEKQRVAAILEQYNNDLTLAPEEDAAFAQLAREHTARHPLRTDLWLPAARAVAIWFTPRIELLPVSGHVFPLAQMREDDPVDQEVTSLLFVLNLFYVGLGVWGAARLWRSNPEARPAVVFLALFIVVRTAFLTTLETPEPRYVLVCFPALIAMGAQVFARRSEG
jgi:4-amino-4-deoxy-L-arabinose transferase-like glycosyltransferase